MKYLATLATITAALPAQAHHEESVSQVALSSLSGVWIASILAGICILSLLARRRLKP